MDVEKVAKEVVAFAEKLAGNGSGRALRAAAADLRDALTEAETVVKDADAPPVTTPPAAPGEPTPPPAPAPPPPAPSGDGGDTPQAEAPEAPPAAA